MGRGPRSHNRLTGLLIVDKPMGWSSMDIIRRVRRVTDGAKAGHAGTLDPLATGVVVVCLGKATRLVDQLMEGVKIYETRIDLAAFTCTDDREGPREEIPVPVPPTIEAVRAALDQQIGHIAQRPPAYSAIHVAGQRSYKLARRGEAVELPQRTVRVDAIDLIAYDWPMLDLRITCGKGVYIRSIARDLGTALNTGGHLASLRRTAVGRFTLAMAVDEARLKLPITQDDLLPIDQA